VDRCIYPGCLPGYSFKQFSVLSEESGSIMLMLNYKVANPLPVYMKPFFFMQKWMQPRILGILTREK